MVKGTKSSFADSIRRVRRDATWMKISRFNLTAWPGAACRAALLLGPVCKLLCSTIHPTDKRSSLRGKRLKALITAGLCAQSQKLTAPGIIFVRRAEFRFARVALFDVVVINPHPRFPFWDTALLSRGGWFFFFFFFLRNSACVSFPLYIYPCGYRRGGGTHETEKLFKN